MSVVTASESLKSFSEVTKYTLNPISTWGMILPSPPVLIVFQSASLRISLAMLICYAARLQLFVRSRSSPLPAAKHLL